MQVIRKSSFLVASLILFFALVLSISPSWTQSSAPSSQRTAQGAKLPKRPPVSLVQQSTNAPISVLDDPALAELTLNNNGAQPFAVTPTLYTPEGDIIKCAPVLLGGLQVQTVRIADLVPDEDKTRNQWGGIQLSYLGVPMQLAAQLVLSSRDLPASFDVPFTETMDFKSDIQNAVWWTPKTADEPSSWEMLLSIRPLSMSPFPQASSGGSKSPDSRQRPFLSQTPHREFRGATVS